MLIRHCHGHWTIYTNIKPLCCTSETKVLFDVNYVWIFKILFFAVKAKAFFLGQSWSCQDTMGLQASGVSGSNMGPNEGHWGERMAWDGLNVSGCSENSLTTQEALSLRPQLPEEVISCDSGRSLGTWQANLSLRNICALQVPEAHVPHSSISCLPHTICQANPKACGWLTPFPPPHSESQCSQVPGREAKPNTGVRGTFPRLQIWSLIEARAALAVMWASR